MCFFLCGIWELDDGVTISLNAKAESIIMFGTRVSGREREISLYSKSIWELERDEESLEASSIWVREGERVMLIFVSAYESL